MGDEYKEDVTRMCSLFSVLAWHKGESEELEKWVGAGFFKHLFVSKNGTVTLYYNVKEGDNFYEKLYEVLTEDFFDELCEYFFELVERKEDIKTDEEIFELIVMAWPAFTIFDELSKDLELGTNYMIRRLMKIRKTTEAFAYEVESKADTSYLPEDYIFFEGKLFYEKFDEFIKRRGIIIAD